MAFTASLDFVEKQDDGRLRLLITYTDGVSKSQQNLFVDSSFDATALKNVVINRLAQLGSLDALKKALVLGPIDTTPMPPSQAELDKQIFFSNLGKLNGLDGLVKLGVIFNSAQEYTDLKTLVTSEYKKEYYGL